MGIPPVGAVVLIQFPFADLKTYKKRPAVVVAHSSMETVILSQITSRDLERVPSVPIARADFSSGGLPQTSYARPDKLFTVEASSLLESLGILSPMKNAEIRRAIKKLF